MTDSGLPELPPDLAKAIDKEPDDASTQLSAHRTQLSEHRTALSEHRTGLSDHRTDLSEHRTALSDTRSHLANERTHLAYLRTALSLMSFGITINRFSIYLQQGGETAKLNQSVFALRDAANVGLGMVIVGSLLLLWALLRYRRVHTQIVEENFEPSSTSVTVLTVTIIALGAVSAVWLMLT